MAQIRVSDEAAAELKRRADEQRRTIGAVVDIMLEQEQEALEAAS